MTLPKGTRVLKVRALTMNKRNARALAREYDVRRNNLMGLHFEGFADPRDLDASSYGRAVLCTVIGEEDRAFWILGSFLWLTKARFSDQLIVSLEGHPQEGTTINFIALP